MMFKRMIITVVAVLTLGACSPLAYIGMVFGDHYHEAAAVAECESGLDPTARSAGGGNHGLFQINNVHRAAFEQVTGQPWSAVYDPYWNAVYAKSLYDSSGWQPWRCKP